MAIFAYVLVLATALSAVVAQSVYADESQYGYAFFGCMQLNFATYPNPFSTGQLAFQDSVGLTQDACANYCATHGWPGYTATNNVGKCFCGQIFYNAIVVKALTNCQLTCQGNSTEYCGGTYSNIPNASLYVVYMKQGKITNGTASAQNAGFVSSSRSAYYASKTLSLAAWSSSKLAASTSRSIARSSLSNYKISVSASKASSLSSFVSNKLRLSASRSIARSLATSGRLSSSISRSSANAIHFQSLQSAGQLKTISELNAKSSVLAAISQSQAAAAASRAAANSVLSASRATAAASRLSAGSAASASRTNYYLSKSSSVSAASASRSAYLSSLSQYKASMSASKASYLGSLSSYRSSISASYASASSFKSASRAGIITSPYTTTATTANTGTTTTNKYATYPSPIQTYLPAVFDPYGTVCGPGGFDGQVIANDLQKSIYEYHLFCNATLTGSVVPQPSIYGLTNVNVVPTFFNCTQFCDVFNIAYAGTQVACEAIVMDSYGNCTLLTDVVKQNNVPAGRGHQYHYYASGMTGALVLNSGFYPSPTATKPSPTDS